VKSAPASGESPNVDNPPSPQVERIAPDSLKPPSPKGVPNPTGVESALTSPTRATLSHDAAGTSRRPEPDEFPEAPPLSPQFGGLRATDGPQHGDGSSVPQSREQS
jgi:hypothetical protein